MARKRTKPASRRKQRPKPMYASAPEFPYPDDNRTPELVARLEALIESDPELKRHVDLIADTSAAVAAEDLEHYYEQLVREAEENAERDDDDDDDGEMSEAASVAFTQGYASGVKAATRHRAGSRATAWFLLLLAFGACGAGALVLQTSSASSSVLAGFGLFGLAVLFVLAAFKIALA